MAQVTNTYSSYDSVGNREELADKIYQISPQETPFIAMIGKQKVVSTHPEWQTDTLATPDPDNASVEGDDWSFQAIAPTTRVGNYTQISNKKVIISRTQDKTSKAGRKREMARELAKKGVELRTDMETALLKNQASVAGNDSTARRAGGFAAWLETNALRGSGGSDGGFNSGTNIVDAATNGTQRAFTKALLDECMEDTFGAGGNPTTLMTSTYGKRVFSGFINDSDTAALRSQVKGKEQATITAGADVYISDFGTLIVKPNRQMTRVGATAARQFFLIDPNMVSMGTFDDIKQEKVAKTGDAEKRVLICEYTLCVKNEAAHGVIADVYGMTSST